MYTCMDVYTGTCIHEHTECVVTVHCVCPGTRMSSVVTITASLSIRAAQIPGNK